MKLWVDVVRPAPEGYKWAKSVHEAKIHICQMRRPNGTYAIEVIDIGHDAGDFTNGGDDYIKLLDWLKETGRNYPIHIHINRGIEFL